MFSPSPISDQYAEKRSTRLSVIFFQPSGQLALLIMLVVSIGAYLLWQVQRAGKQMPPIWEEGQPLPPGGFAPNNTQGNMPGNPQNAIEDFHRIYRAFGIFKNRHGNRPADLSALRSDMLDVPSAYGISSGDKGEVFDQVTGILTNPDSRFSDDSSARLHPERSIEYILPARRPDASVMGGKASSEAQDILLFTKLYYYSNTRILPGDEASVKPVGVYVVLWGDGRVEAVPWRQVLFVPKGANAWVPGFKGQSGLPPGCLTVEQFKDKYRLKHMMGP